MSTQQRRTWPDGASALVEVTHLNGRRWTVVRFHSTHPRAGLVAVEPDPGRRHPMVTGRHVGSAPSAQMTMADWRFQ